MNKLLKKYPGYLLILLIIGMSFLYDYHEIIVMRPFSAHQWRQTDALSIALNYYKEGMNFFQPAMHYQGGEGGKGVGEFPIVYYLNALVWKVIGHSEIWARILTMLMVYGGLFCLYRLAKEILQSGFWASVLVLIMYTSPLFVFFTNNFMVNLPAAAFVFMGWYAFWKFYRTGQGKFFGWMIAAFSIASLLRITMAMGYLPIMILMVMEMAGKWKSKERYTLFRKRPLRIGLMLLPAFLTLVWYGWAQYYNHVHDSGYFLTKALPVWASPDPLVVMGKFFHTLMSAFHFSSLRFLLIAILPGILFFRKKFNFVLWLFTTTITICIFLYVMMWFQNLDAHEYYLIEFFILLVPAFLTLFDNLRKKRSKLFNGRGLKLSAILILCAYTYACTVKMRMKYDYNDPIVQHSFLLSEDEKTYWSWYHWDYGRRVKAYESAQAYLESIGLNRKDVIISYPDFSTNQMLYLMDMKGYTGIHFTHKTDAERMYFFIDRGAKYMIVNEETALEPEWIHPFIEKKIGTYENLQIFDLSNLQRP